MGLAAYKDGAVVDGTRAETNFVAYVATGIWHHYLINPDSMFLQDMWPVARAAMEFIADLQTSHGEVYWALDTRTGINKDALITGCSSIYKSLECMANICVVLGQGSPWMVTDTRAARSRDSQQTGTLRPHLAKQVPLLDGLVLSHPYGSSGGRSGAAAAASPVGPVRGKRHGLSLCGRRAMGDGRRDL